MATDKKIGDNLIARLKKSAAELEELQLQLALGKAEAQDKYEEVKKKFDGFVHSVKTKLKKQELASELIADIEHLQVQLALGKAETKELFGEQKKKVLRAISKLEKRMTSAPIVTETEEEIRHEIETFRIKLELLDLHFALGSMEARDEFEKRKKELSNALARMKAKYEAGKSKVSKTLDQRQTELKEAYRHLKKAVL